MQFLALNIKTKNISLFFSLLEKGFMVEVKSGVNVKDVLCKILRLDADYVDDRIQTLFLNRKVIDDPDTTLIIQDNSTLALSAAMPGLVGAVLRKSGKCSSFRSIISYNNAIKSRLCNNKINLHIKLFNIIAKETGEILLQKGILISGKNFYNFLLKQNSAIWRDCEEVFCKNKGVISKDKLLDYALKQEKIFLSVKKV